MRTTVRSNKAECTGCGACVSVCPKAAITMQMDEEGFLYPAVDGALCVGCDLCGKYCPTEATFYDKQKKELIFRYENCIGCGQCVSKCKFDVRRMVKDERDVFVKTKKRPKGN